MTVPSDIAIAQAAKMRPIADVARDLGLTDDELILYGKYKAKVALSALEARKPKGRLVLVTGITPTAAGEGKSTVSVGLTQALRRMGKNSVVCLREPSLGPVFGVKGGAAGGGYAQVVPMEDINLHFTGDFHAVSSAHNLLSAMLDNHIYQGNALRFALRRITWPRTMDMNDRALRTVIVGVGASASGPAREDRFVITPASEIMAILCLATSREDLEERLARIIVGTTHERTPIRAADLKASGSMALLLKDAVMPNLVQTLEGGPAFVHGGPFANIAHGCNSVLATTTALKLADYVVTEAGFGADLGAEKFFNIKCRKAGLKPAAAVIVATVRALKMHGGVAREALGVENVAAVAKGCANLARHIANVKRFGVPAVVALNRFDSDTDAEIEAVKSAAREHDTETVVCTHWSDGGRGCADLARHVVDLCDHDGVLFRPLYGDDMKLWDKVATIATSLYGASEIAADTNVRQRFRELEAEGFGKFPICMAKTQYSFSTDARLKGAPSGHVVGIREVRLSAGAEFVVVITGDIMTMPGLPREPSATAMHLNDAGEIEGLS